MKSDYTPTIKNEVLNTKTKVQDINDDVHVMGISCQVTAQLSLTEKSELYALIHSKGFAGLTAFLKMLSKAKEVQIKI